MVFPPSISAEILPACTACMRCCNFCPTASVWYCGQYADPDEFIRYMGPAEELGK